MDSNFETTGEFFKSRLRGEPVRYEDLLPPFPRVCLVETTNACNQACMFCANPKMKRKTAHLDLDLFSRFVKAASRLGLREMGFYTTGEPFVTRNLHRFVEEAAKAGIAYRYLTTNGSLATPQRCVELIEAGLNSFKFSINGATKETYRAIHGKDEFETVLANVQWLYQYRKRTGSDFRILGSFVITRANEGEKSRHRELFGPMMDDILYLEVDGQQGQAIEEATLALGRPLKFPKEGAASPCPMLWSRIHLTAEGYLTLCCVDYENNLTYGSFRESEDLMALWHNARIREMRRRHLEHKLEGTLCHKCLYGKGEYQPLESL